MTLYPHGGTVGITTTAREHPLNSIVVRNTKFARLPVAEGRVTISRLDHPTNPHAATRPGGETRWEVFLDGTSIGTVESERRASHRKAGRIIVGTSYYRTWVARADGSWAYRALGRPAPILGSVKVAECEDGRIYAIVRLLKERLDHGPVKS